MCEKAAYLYEAFVCNSQELRCAFLSISPDRFFSFLLDNEFSIRNLEIGDLEAFPSLILTIRNCGAVMMVAT